MWLIGDMGGIAVSTSSYKPSDEALFQLPLLSTSFFGSTTTFIYSLFSTINSTVNSILQPLHLHPESRLFAALGRCQRLAICDNSGWVMLWMQ